ncbi:MAG TPA: ATP-grasp domain-containing protein [Longimicrobium sp.]|jgi:argininosuccinate lyase|nr:ATP-grasp domain-containing protein [Longimicrobium sp.]
MSARALLLVESNTSGTGRLFVRAAREMGFTPVLVTARPGAYAFLADEDAPEVLVVERTDEDALEPLLRARYGADGIAGITSSSEYFVATAAALAARFGLPGPGAAAVHAARDKSWQRRTMADAGLPTPAFRPAASAPEAIWAAREIGFPVVVKPVSGSGSVGVRACATAAEVGRHAAALLSRAVAAGEPRRVLVEERIDGPEFSVELFSGRVVGITRKHLGDPPCFVEAGHDYPAEVEPDVARALEEAVVRATALLGLGWGPLHWELRMRGAEAVAIEVNPRLAGGFIPELVRHAQGIDLIRQTLRLVVGEAPELAPVRARHASIRFLFAPGDGRLEAADGLGAARAVPGVVDATLYRAPGDLLAVRGDFRDRIGHVIACADSFAGACAAAERGRGAVRVHLGGAARVPQEVG